MVKGSNQTLQRSYEQLAKALVLPVPNIKKVFQMDYDASHVGTKAKMGVSLHSIAWR